jgi:DNA-binding winged helix-turn-helix (wHTH) protein
MHAARELDSSGRFAARLERPLRICLSLSCSVWTAGFAFAGSTRLIFVFDGFEFDVAALELYRAGAPIKADALVLRLLSVLVRHAGELVTKRDLIAHTWQNRAVSENVLAVAVARLRKTLKGSGLEHETIANVHGRGYRFLRPVELTAARGSKVAPDATFVGRARVLQHLREHMRHAVAGRGSACVLIGDPGIGKTRTLEMLEQESSALGMNAAWGFCREAGDTPPLSPLARIARDVLSRHGFDGLAAKLGPSAVELARLWPELGLPVKPSASNTGFDAIAALSETSLAKQRSFAAIARLFEVASERQPWLFVLDDLQHADSATADFLQYWIAECTRTRIAWLASLRASDADGGKTPPRLRGFVGHHNCELIPLAPLSEADVAGYVASTCDDADGSLGRAVYAKSEGNPFFMVELSRRLRLCDVSQAAELALPQTALALVRWRIASADSETETLLACAAVIGRSFELPLLQAASGFTIERMMASLDRAALHGVIDGVRDSKIGFSFRHALMRDVFYDALSPAERRGLHLAVATALERSAVQGLLVPPSDLAFHFYAAMPETDLRKTVRYCSDASVAAAAVYANSEGARYLQQALEALALIPNASRRLRYGLSVRRAVLLRALSSRGFERAAREALQLAHELDDGELLGHAALLYGLHPGFPALPGARAALELALERLPEDHPTRAAVLARLVNLAPIAFDAAASDEALKLARARTHEAPMARYAALSAQLYTKAREVGPQPSAAAMSELTALCQAYSNVLTVSPVLMEHQRVIMALQAGDDVQAAAALARCEKRARELGHLELLWHAERMSVLWRIDRGEDATALLRALHQRSVEHDILGTELFCAYDRALVLGEIASYPDPALALDPDDPPSIFAMKLRALVSVGAVDHARAALTRLPRANIARLPQDRDYLGTLGALTRVCLQLNETAYYAPLDAALTSAPRCFAIHVSGHCEGAVEQLQGMLSLAQGEEVRALDLLQRGLDQCRAAGLTLCAREIERTLRECTDDAGARS